MTINEAIAKYNLEKQPFNNNDTPRCYGEEYYTGHKEKYNNDNKLLYIKDCTLTNELSSLLSNGRIYFLTIKKKDYTKLKYSEKSNKYFPTRTTKILRVTG